MTTQAKRPNAAHETLRGLLQRLEAGFTLEPGLARERAERLLTVLVPALDRHAELQRLAKRPPADAEACAAARARALALDTLAHCRDYPLPALDTAVAELAGLVRRQLEWEEARTANLPRGAAIRRRAADFRAEMKTRERLASQYLKEAP